jgi:hypothetical protein
MTGDPILVRIVDFCLWLGSALGGFGTLYFLGPEHGLKWSGVCLAVMILFLSFRDLLVKQLRRKLTKET